MERMAVLLLSILSLSIRLFIKIELYNHFLFLYMLCSNSDEKFASIASIEANKSDLPFKHGCIAVTSGKIVAKGYNHYRTYSKDGLIKNCCSCHAEIDVIRKCLKKGNNKKINLYIVRISDLGELRNSKPCNQCVSIMKNINIKYIIYSTFNGLSKCKLYNLIKSYLDGSLHLTGGEKAINNKRVLIVKKGNTLSFKDMIVK